MTGVPAILVTMKEHVPSIRGTQYPSPALILTLAGPVGLKLAFVRSLIM